MYCTRCTRRRIGRMLMKELGVTRRKTTLYLDPDVVTATKVVAATTARSESDVVEAALRGLLAHDGGRRRGEGPVRPDGTARHKCRVGGRRSDGRRR